jgi:hypothetical protein
MLQAKRGQVMKASHLRLRTFLALIAFLTVAVWVAEMWRRSVRYHWSAITNGEMSQFHDAPWLSPEVRRKKLYHLRMSRLYDRASRYPWRYAEPRPP